MRIFTRRRRRRGPLLFAIALIAVIVLGAWGVGLILYAGDIPSGVADTSTPTDAIVVLTGRGAC